MRVNFTSILRAPFAQIFVRQKNKPLLLQRQAVSFVCFVHCLYVTGPAIFDNNKRLVQLTVIPLSGGHSA
jgi:hypothetical protein